MEKTAVREAMTVPKESLVRDHAATGETKNAVKEVMRQVRVL